LTSPNYFSQLAKNFFYKTIDPQISARWGWGKIPNLDIHMTPLCPPPTFPSLNFVLPLVTGFLV